MTAVNRRTQIVKLLQTRDDHLPQPTRRDHAAAGFVHNTTVRETCPDCFGENPGKTGCETCGSRGYLETTRVRDPYLDPKQSVFDKSSQAQRDRQTAMDAEIGRLAGQTRPPYASLQDELAATREEPWERERDLRWERYDYAALDRALEALAQADDGAYRMLHACYVYGWLEPSSLMEGAIMRALAFVDARMPDPIRAPGDELDPVLAKESLWRGKSERHAARREARKLRVVRASLDWGWSVTQIAAHESLSARRVRQLLADHAGVDAAVASGPAA